jgi:bifunctional enzyme CysN/CysC
VVEAFTLWLTGLPAAGKSTLANELWRRLPEPSELLDGDRLRATISRDLGFGRADRATSCARAGALALSTALRPCRVVVAHLSPYAEDRTIVRARHAEAGVPFVEIYVATPLDVCRRRDPKGLYARCALGTVQNLTGVDAPYEPPTAPELTIAPEDLELQADRVLAWLETLSAGPARAQS